jgi:hypothetical protein
MRKTAEQEPRRVDDANTRKSKESELRWSSVRPIDFEGEDESLTQPQLAILK